MLIGEPLHDDAAMDEGSAYVFAGSAAGPVPAPAFAWTDPDHQGSAYFGYAVCRVAW